MGLEEQFKSVAESVRNWQNVNQGSESLELYSLYKQATVGDVNIPEPSSEVDNAKWKAWSSHKGMSQDEAKQKYIDLANEYQSKYA